MSAPHVVVVGGGLAGLSAAVACADGGARVTLLESRPRLGGATWSFRRNGLSFDNGQHVYMRCCTAYRRFLERIGSSSLAPMQDRLEIPVLRPSSRGTPTLSWIRRGRLPAPLHLGASLLGYRHLGVADRARLGRAVLALRALRLTDPALDAETFGSFLSRHGQSEDAVAALWDVITLPTVNLRSDEASLALAAKVFRTGLLSDAGAADLGWARVPLSRLHADAAAEALRRAGAHVRTGAKVAALRTGPGPSGATSAVTGVVVDGHHLEADAVVLAVPHEAAAGLLPAGGSVDPAALPGLGRSPIVDVHVVYDRRVLPYEVAAAVGSPVQFAFDTTRSSGLDPADGQVVAVSVSGADSEHGERPEALVERYTSALATLFPAARGAKVVDAVVSREHAATFRGRPGTQRLRPRPDVGVPGLHLAGAWTDTGWPATMEGAVRSGVAAAADVMRSVGRERAVSCPGALHEHAEEVVA
ncbi:MAG: hydroxysqualene dehydroxylase HpnE [Actinomycetota bacterium]|nr:hydroxysqualene dehydroxylase HpnE [Actinomycetota bacterium]